MMKKIFMLILLVSACHAQGIGGKGGVGGKGGFGGGATVSGTTFVSVLQNPTSPALNFCPSQSNGGTCAGATNSTGSGNMLLWTVLAGNSGGEPLSDFTSLVPTNGQGCTAWTLLSAANLIGSQTNFIYRTYFCASSLSATTSVTWTLAVTAGSDWFIQTQAPWEVSYTGTAPTFDNACTATVSSAAGTISGCTISSITGANDALFSFIFSFNNVLTGTGGTGWTGVVQTPDDEFAVSTKLNTTTLTPPTATISTSDFDDIIGVAIQ